MNRFSTDLHPSFFGIEDGSSYEAPTPTPTPTVEGQPEAPTPTPTIEGQGSNKEKEGEQKDVIDAAQGEEEKLQEEIISNMANEVYSDVLRYADREQLNRDRQRCQIRMTTKDQSDTMYRDIRNKKMNAGYGHLLTELKENGYANGMINGKRISEAEIKKMYLDECKKQFKDKIWSAGDKQFDQVKDTIFGRDSDKYPADKVYRDLTGAATIHEIDRVSMEGYDPDILDEGLSNNPQSVENMGDKQNRNFLKNDLTEYLWNIKKTPGIVKALQWLPIFNAKVDKPSDEDRKAIDNFLKVAEKITVSTGEDKAVALLKLLSDSELNTNTPESKYAEVLNKRGITVEKKYLDDLVRVGKFYLSTQIEANSPKNQHAIYLSVLKIIEKEGGVSNAVRKFKPIVEQAKQDAKTEKKEGYSDGRKLDQVDPELKTIASKLSITDFTNATRLAVLDNDYFQKTPVEKVLANLNNDRMIDARDIGGEKSGQQFLAVFNQVGKETALNNLFARAKLENDMLGLGLDDVFKGAATQIDATTLLETFNGGQATDQPKDGAPDQSGENGVPAVVDNLPTVSKLETEIKNGNKKLILLLQNIISKPGSDLISLMSRDVSKDPFEGLNLTEAKASADKAAAEMISKMNVEQLRLAGFQTPESMQSGLANALYTEYTRGIGIGGKIPFDQWVKGLDLNAGFQYRNDGNVAIGLGINYKASANLGKGWYMNPELSAGAFIPLGYGKVDAQSIGGAGLNLETAYERVRKSGTLQHIGLNTGARVSFTGAVVVSAGLNRSQDRVKGIDKAEQELKGRFGKEVIGPILVGLDARGIKKLDFSNSDVVNNVQALIREYASKNGIKEEDMETVVDSTLRLLINYNNADISQPEIRDIISQEVAERFALAWANGKKEDATKGAYLGGASVGAFWLVGAPYLGIYAGIQINKHNLDGYGDRWGKEYGLDHQYEGGWNEDLIKAFNQEAGFSEAEGLKVDNGFVIIPKNLAYRVNVNGKLKGNMKKDGEGNILLHVQTPMAAKKRQGTATQSKEIIIGGRAGDNFIKLDKAGADWFTDGDINATDILNLGEGIRTYSPDLINKAIEELKGKVREGDKIHQLTIDDAKMTDICDKANKINVGEGTSDGKPHKVKLVIDTDANGNLTIMDPVEGDEGRGLDMEYNAKFEMLDSTAKGIANKVYAEALKLSNPEYLYQVKHTINNKPWPEYDPFDKAMQSGDYQTAREKIKPIFRKLDEKYRGQSHFSEVLAELDKIEDNVALGQALMSIRNVFARAKSVKGGTDGQYHFGSETMSEIIARRAGSTKRGEQIKGTLKRSNIPDEYKSAYLNLLDASEGYRKATGVFNKKEAKAAELDNTIGFNLGDHTDPENPLFNPQVYDPMVDLKDLEAYGFTADQRNALHERAMNKFATNPVLYTPILRSLNLDDGTKPTVREFKDGKLTLDVGGKQITISADLNFGYFTQCVNHTVILSNISAVGPDGTSVQFNSGVWESGSYREGSKSTITSTTSINIGVGVVTGRGGDGAATHQEGGTSTGSGIGGSEQGGSTGTGQGEGGGNSGSGGGGR